jgi:hypothetical protein
MAEGQADGNGRGRARRIAAIVIAAMTLTGGAALAGCDPTPPCPTPPPETTGTSYGPTTTAVPTTTVPATIVPVTLNSNFVMAATTPKTGYQFQGQQGQLLNLVVRDIPATGDPLTFTGSQFPVIHMIDQCGLAVANLSWPPANFSETINLPRSGTYTMFWGDNVTSGSMHVDLTAAAVDPDPLVVNDAAGRSVSLPSSGQSAIFHADLQAGLSYSVVLTDFRLADTTIFDPSGARWAWGSGDHIDYVAPTAGTYTIIVTQPKGQAVDTTLYLSSSVDEPPLVMGDPNGDLVNFTIPGQVHVMTFDSGSVSSPTLAISDPTTSPGFSSFIGFLSAIGPNQGGTIGSYDYTFKPITLTASSPGAWTLRASASSVQQHRFAVS